MKSLNILWRCTLADDLKEKTPNRIVFNITDGLKAKPGQESLIFSSHLPACLCSTHGQCNTYILLHDLGGQRANN